MEDIVLPRVKLPRPDWLRIRVAPGDERDKVRKLMSRLKLHTVCASAQCPNLCECFHHSTATYLIMGNACTRNCKFCAVPHSSHPEPLDAGEPERVAEASAELGLKFVVVTCVTRDDLPDGGAAHFAATVKALKARIPDVKVEVLVSDLHANREHIKTVLDSGPTVFNHNIETVERLSSSIRSVATYRRTLEVLKIASELAQDKIPVKSGLMVGLGETDEEVEATLRDLRAAGVSIVTIGQYLPPSDTHWPLQRYVTPEKFDEWAQYARELGFKQVASAPLVRSSYRAGELANHGC
ncbi:MAG: lipoyl synthase [Lentisphaerae bacterium]|nr:lipoyl synthase [Lentisphaerota bacterium]